MLLIQLKKFVKSEKLVKIKNSYEVSTSENVKLVAAAAASIKESEKTDKAVVKNGEKTKRLSQVKTPKALKKEEEESFDPCEEELIQVGQEWNTMEYPCFLFCLILD
ncbi:hypothetical protein HYC85_027715 [Camellia sinensis]|uniref:H15 domain-containing protein n=1 Tax=Camellia sinensis TaxID=4442 RepID=A0A7J7FX69_CAMSI|nr:hypothetical protein HYC85_027715 [Camellia sinensis]